MAYPIRVILSVVFLTFSHTGGLWGETSAEYIPTGDPEIGFSNYGFSTNENRDRALAQTFTPLVGGFVDEVSVFLQIKPNPDSPSMTIDVSILGLNVDGVPTDFLETVSFVAPAVLNSPTPTFFSADFSGTGLSLSTDTSYAIRLSTPEPVNAGEVAAYSWVGDRGGYGGGKPWESLDDDPFQEFGSNDYGFRVTVVPEPSSLVMLGLGLTGVVLWRRR